MNAPRMSNPPGRLSKLDHIKELRSRGYSLIPLNGKIPAVKNWTSAGPLDFSEEALTKNNYGVALKNGDLVIDVDPRNFAPGDKPLTRLVAAIGVPLSTFTIRTGSGGLHIYFTKPADVIVSHTLKEYPGLEFKSSGRQVVGPGSVHPDTGKPYVVAAGGVIAPAPQKLLDLIKTTGVPYAEIEKGDMKNATYQSDEGTQKRYVDYLLGAEMSVEGKGGDATAFKVAAVGRDYGLAPAITLSLLCTHWNPRCSPPWDESELESKVIHAYKYARGAVGDKHPAAGFTGIEVSKQGDEKKGAMAEKREEIVWETTANGQVKKSFFNLLNYLKLPTGGLDRVFGFNEFTGQVEFIAPAPWHGGRLPSGEGEKCIQDKDLALLKGYLAIKHGFEQSVGSLAEAIVVVSHGNKFHPVREYLEGLKWDGKPRLDQWLVKYAGAADSTYTRAVGRKTLCAAVARILRPGCKFDQVLTLEGNQGAGKSMLCAALGGQWSADFSVDPQDPDTVAAMQGKWFVELAELAVLRRTEMSALKAFITRRTDKVRVAYGRLHQEYPRQSIFIGSINPEADNAYLADPTGNRRWWPVAVGDRINFEGVRRDRDQLFAEAVCLMTEKDLAKREALYMDNQGLESEARGIVEQRQVEHAWTERISAWLADRTLGGGLEFVTARDIFIDAMGGIDKQLTRKEIIAIATVMRRLGWESVTQRQGERVLRGYVRGGGSAMGSVNGEENVMEGLI